MPNSTKKLLQYSGLLKRTRGANRKAILHGWTGHSISIWLSSFVTSYLSSFGKFVSVPLTMVLAGAGGQGTVASSTSSCAPNSPR